MHISKTKVRLVLVVAMLCPLESWASSLETVRCLSDDGQLSLSVEAGRESWVVKRVKQNIVREFVLSPGKDLTIKRWDVSKVEAPLGRFSDKHSTVEMWLERVEILRPSQKEVVVLETTLEGYPSHTVEKIEAIITCRKTTWQKEIKFQVAPGKQIKVPRDDVK